MTLIQALLSAVTAETACIVFLFGILLLKNKAQDKRLELCEADRQNLHEKHSKMQSELTDVWKWIATKKDLSS